MHLLNKIFTPTKTSAEKAFILSLLFYGIFVGVCRVYTQTTPQIEQFSKNGRQKLKLYFF